MAAYYFNDNIFLSGNCYSGFLDPFSRDLGPCNGISQSLVLDNEKSELVVKSPVKVGKKSSHSEAERRRRERINAHLDTLRTLLPYREKMDKATLLGEVVRQVKELKKAATEASKGFLVPVDDDEVIVETCNDEANGTYCFKASICCDYRPQLLTDLRQALDCLPIKMVKAEISTLGSRLRKDFVFTGCRTTAHGDDAESWQHLACSVRRALNSVLEKASISPEYLPYSTFPKRQRISYFDSSSSSS
ncbi:hypothetical protein V6Z11_A10G035100 [Gossypium hirsutum]